jgi:hypothetical protein
MQRDKGDGTLPPQRNMWRDGLWIGAVAFAIITLGALYQTWLHLGPQGQQKRAELKGNGVDVPSYGFDLSKLAEGVNPNEIRATGIRKGEVPELTGSQYINSQENFNLKGHEKYVVPTDRVIGVIYHDEPMAFPIQVMQVHQVTNDYERPFTVVYDPVCELALAFSTRGISDVGQPASYSQFAVSGLEYKGVSLLYDKAIESAGKISYSQDVPELEQSLWSPILGMRISRSEGKGAAAQVSDSFSLLPTQVLQWRDWLELHPNTSIVERDELFKEQYKEDRYGPYYLTERLPFPLVPKPPPAKLEEFGLGLKSRGIGMVAGITSSHQRVFFPYDSLLANAKFDKDGLGTMTYELWGNDLTFHCRRADKGFTPATAWMEQADKPGTVVQAAGMCMLFAWYANFPDTYILAIDGQLRKP